MLIPLFDPTPRIARVRADLHHAFSHLLDQGTFILGPSVASFEQELAAFLGGGETIGVASGSDALELALRALDIGPGQAVLTTPFTFLATAEAILHVGARPVFVDIRSEDLLLDLDGVDQQLARLPQNAHGAPILPTGEVLTALLPVHLFGAVADSRTLKELCVRYHLRLIEDAAQALGGHCATQPTGTFGDAGCFSFFPSKTLGCLGDGGAIWTADPSLAQRLRRLRQHGQPSKREPATELGCNSRLDALQAAMLSVFLPHLKEEIAERRALLQQYREDLADCAGVSFLGPTDLTGHAAQQMILRSPHRDALAAYLNHRGIGTAIYYPTPLPHLRPFQESWVLGSLHHTIQASREVLALPLYSGLEKSAVRTICKDVHKGIQAILGGNICRQGQAVLGSLQ